MKILRSDGEKQIRYIGHPSCPRALEEIKAYLESCVNASSEAYDSSDENTSSGQNVSLGLNASSVLGAGSELDESSGQDEIVCLVIPPITVGMEPSLREILDRIGKRADTEISVNDWGTLQICAEYKREGKLAASLTAGVLLVGQDTDPLLATFCEPQPDKAVLTEQGVAQLCWQMPSNELIRHWSTPSIYSAASLCKRLMVTRIELCAQQFPLSNKALMATEQAHSLPDNPKMVTDKMPMVADKVLTETVTLYIQAPVTVKPCQNDCESCGGHTIMRGGHQLHWNRNLLVYEPEAEIPECVDRVVSLYIPHC